MLKESQQTPLAKTETRVPGWQAWAGLWIIYLVWGSTYLAIRIMVETVPPLVGAGGRFVVAGLILATLVAIFGDVRSLRISRGQVVACALIGLLLPGANALVTVSEQEVPSGLAALIIASVPLWVVIFRLLSAERPTVINIVSVLIGMSGVALLLSPGDQTEGASLIALIGVVIAAATWALGSFLSPRIDLPKDPFVASSWYMVLGGLIFVAIGGSIGEFTDLHPGSFSLESWLSLIYLILIGSIVAFSTYAWLLQHVPIAKVATYAYVNPVVAVFLGWIVLSEAVTLTTIVATLIIVFSVALIIRSNSESESH